MTGGGCVSPKTENFSIRRKNKPLDGASFEIVDFDNSAPVNGKCNISNFGPQSSERFSTADLISAVGYAWGCARKPLSFLLPKSNATFEPKVILEGGILHYSTDQVNSRVSTSAGDHPFSWYCCKTKAIELVEENQEYSRVNQKPSNRQPSYGTSSPWMMILEKSTVIEGSFMEDCPLTAGIPSDFGNMYNWMSKIVLHKQRNPDNSVEIESKRTTDCNGDYYSTSSGNGCQLADKSSSFHSLTTGSVACELEIREPLGLSSPVSGYVTTDECDSFQSSTDEVFSSKLEVRESLGLSSKEAANIDLKPSTTTCSDHVAVPPIEVTDCKISSSRCDAESQDAILTPHSYDCENNITESRKGTYEQQIDHRTTIFQADSSEVDTNVLGKRKPQYALAKQGHAFAGAMAGIFVSLCLHPVDTITMVIQSGQTSQKPLHYVGRSIECGVKRSTGYKTASLFLSRRLGSLAYGFEYGALEVRNHLECLLFSDIVSDIRIWTNCGSSISPWTCHFHIDKEVASKRRLKLSSVISALRMNHKLNGSKSNFNLPKLHITSEICSEDDIHAETTICISAALTQNFQEFSDVEILRDMVIPALLQTVIKGFREFKKVDILWKEGLDQSKFPRSPSSELYLRVVTSECCDLSKFWSTLVDKCLRIRKIIDWERIHPDVLVDYCEAYGIDVAWQYFVNNLHSAISDTGKSILREHLIVAASCLSVTGEFVPLNSRGLAHQRKESNINSPFSQACFLNPSDCFVKAAKAEQMDGLQGILEALSWGQIPSIGTGCQFDIMYKGKGHEPAEQTDVYTLLGTHVGSAKTNDEVKQDSRKSIASYHFNSKAQKMFLQKTLSQQFTVVGIQKIKQKLKRILKEYPINRRLSVEDKSTAMIGLNFHPKL